MEKINRHNYEAFFLDFAEGNLSATQVDELNLFLVENPELQLELDGFEIVELRAARIQSSDWKDLKKPGIEKLKRDVTLREEFFIRAIEKLLTEPEVELLDTLLKDNLIKKEFELWQNLILLAGDAKMNKDSLYQFGLNQVLSDWNYEYYLIAHCEGLLTSEQTQALEKFAMSRPMGAREVEMAKSLRLTAAKGIFFPDKVKLYRKEKKGVLIWLYRVAAVAAVLLLGVFIWNQSHTEIDVQPPTAQKITPEVVQPAAQDSTEKSRIQREDSLQNAHDLEEPALQEWEVREPDEVNYAEAATPEKMPATPKVQIQPEYIESVDMNNLAVNAEPHDLPADLDIIYSDSMLKTPDSVKESTVKTFNSVPKYAEDLLAQKLNIPDSEKDEMAIVLAKRITSKASELLDAEYTKEATGNSGDESLTYTLRIGSFKVQRTKNK